MRNANPDFPEHKRHVVECDCVGTCTLLIIERWDDATDPDDEFYASIYTQPHNWSWRFRLKTAWQALLGKNSNSGELVFARSQAEDLYDWLWVRLWPDMEKNP
jgi:hypothetical protein